MSSYRRPQRDQRDCVLITAGCTTGWTDWIHGELWSCPDGILRRSLGLLTTIKHGLWPTVNDATRPRRSFSTSEVATVLTTGRRNLWIPWAEISGAVLTPVSLTARLNDGRAVRLLWPPVESNGFLKAELSRMIADRLDVR